MYVYHSIAPRRFKIEIYVTIKIVCYCISNRVRFLIELHEFFVYSTPLEHGRWISDRNRNTNKQAY